MKFNSGKSEWADGRTTELAMAHRPFAPSPVRPLLRPGFAMIEAVMATVIMAIALAAALQTAAAAGVYQLQAAEQTRASGLANDMVSEIMYQPYQDVSATLSGPGRTAFNDIDDYNGWTESPLQNKDGSTIPNTTGWTRSVSVCFLTTSGTVSALDTGIKEIVVTVSQGSRPLVTRVFLRTNHP